MTPLDLCLVRHGIAEDRRPGVADWQRVLTPSGRTQIEAGAAGLATLISPGLVLTSPLPRARQTAEILSAAMDAPIEECDALANGDHASLVDACRSQTVAAVGHEPHVSRFVAWALGAQPVALDVREGTAVLVRFRTESAPGAGALGWLLPPSVLQRLGGAERG